MMDYVSTFNLNQNTGSYAFLDTNLVSVFRQQSGQDITKPLNVVLNSMTAANRQIHIPCLKNAFLAGEVDFRKTARSQVQNYFLIAASVVLMTSIALKCQSTRSYTRMFFDVGYSSLGSLLGSGRSWLVF